MQSMGGMVVTEACTYSWGYSITNCAALADFPIPSVLESILPSGLHKLYAPSLPYGQLISSCVYIFMYIYMYMNRMFAVA